MWQDCATHRFKTQIQIHFETMPTVSWARNSLLVSRGATVAEVSSYALSFAACRAEPTLTSGLPAHRLKKAQQRNRLLPVERDAKEKDREGQVRIDRGASLPS